MVDNKSRKSKDNVIKLYKELFDKSNIRMNLAQEILVTTVDKVKLCLIEYQGVLKSQRSWMTPAGILITLVVSLMAADFKNFWGVKAEVWQALFIFFSLLCLFWFIITLIRAGRNYKKGKLDSLIEKLKKTPET